MSVLQTCKHPTVVEYIESLMHDNHLFIIMELMDGGSLTNLIQVSPSPDRWPAHPSRVRMHTGLPGPSQALRPPPPPHTHCWRPCAGSVPLSKVAPREPSVAP